MKNLKKVVLGSFAVVAVVAISFFSSNSETSFANTQEEVSANEVQYASVIDWSNYDFNSSTEAEKCGAGKCGADKKKAETKKESKKCGGDKASSAKKAEKCGGDKASTEKKAEKCGGEKAKKEKKSAKCGTGKCGKA